MAHDFDPTFVSSQSDPAPRATDARMQPYPHAPTPVPRVHPPANPLGLLLSAGIAGLLCGLAGAWAYVEHLRPVWKHEEKAELSSSEQASNREISSLTTRLDNVGSKLDDLQVRVDKAPPSVSPAQLAPIHQKMEALDELSTRFDALGKQVNALLPRMEENGKTLASTAEDLRAIHEQMDLLKGEVRASVKAAKGTETPLKTDEALASVSHDTPRAGEATQAASIEQGATLFHNKNYTRASSYFAELTRSKPEDARVWYFAALARGLATNDWKGQTVEYVNSGVEREKAGTPAKEKIDATFAGLTTSTGKDWLHFYRERAR